MFYQANFLLKMNNVFNLHLKLNNKYEKASLRSFFYLLFIL